MNNIINRAANIFMFAFVALTLIAVPIAAHAADLTLDGGGDYGSSYSTPIDYGSSYSTPIDYGSNYSTPVDYGSSYSTPVDYGSSYSTPVDYGSSYSTPVDYGSGYSTPSYGSSGYSTGGYSTGGYSTGGGYYAPAPYYSTPSYGAPSNTNVNTNVNTNTCLNNSCNTDSHSVVNIQNPAPVINNVVANYGSTNTTQYCASGYSGTYPNCYINQQPVVYQHPPIAYNAATPYVTLSQVPYTGLDLGFWGTIAYWGFMFGFALVVAYLIAIKRVQNTIALSFKHFLFGTTEEGEEEVTVVTTPAPVQMAYAAPAASALPQGSRAQTSEDVIDSFILSQINRPRHA